MTQAPAVAGALETRQRMKEIALLARPFKPAHLRATPLHRGRRVACQRIPQKTCSRGPYLGLLRTSRHRSHQHDRLVRQRREWLSP